MIGMKEFMLAAFLACLIVPNRSLYAQGARAVPGGDGGRLVAFKATASKNHYRRTEPVPIVIEAKNLSNDSIILHVSGREHSILSIDVTDEFGEEVPDTRFAVYGSSGTGITEIIPKGKTLTFKIYLNTLKDMTQPGLYDVGISLGFRAKSENDKKFASKSAPVKIRIDDEAGR